MHMCKKCGKLFSLLVLVLGVLFLLQDLGQWNFWGVSWYTALFLLLGISHLGTGYCKDCQAKKK